MKNHLAHKMFFCKFCVLNVFSRIFLKKRTLAANIRNFTGKIQYSPSVCQVPNYHQNMQMWSLKKIRDYKDLKLCNDFRKFPHNWIFFFCFWIIILLRIFANFKTLDLDEIWEMKKKLCICGFLWNVYFAFCCELEI